METSLGGVKIATICAKGLAKTPLCRYIGMAVCNWAQGTPKCDCLATTIPSR